MEDSSRRFYRIVRTDPPTAADFLSYEAEGRPLLNNRPTTVRMWRGISVYERESQARKKGKGLPWRGQGYIAELHLPADTTIRAERTGNSEGHFTLWGDAGSILASVTRVVPIRVR